MQVFLRDQLLQPNNRLLLGALAVFVLNLVFSSAFLGVVFLIMVLLGISSKSSTVELFGKDSIQRLLIGCMLWCSLLSLLLTGSYFLFPTLSIWWVSFIFISLILTWILIPSSGQITKPKLPRKSELPFLVPVILGDLLLIGLFLTARTADPLISVWNMFGPEVFVIFGLTTLFLFISARQSRAVWYVLATQMLHVLVMVSVAAIVHAVGFGFDPFIHRAAETALAETGSILPKQILYSGQYVLVSALHLVTKIPLTLIDIWLVPIFASLFLPLATFVGLKTGWGKSETSAKTWSIVLFILPFMLTVFTVPFTMTYAFFLGLVYLLPIVFQSLVSRITITLFSAMMILFHPLLAGPIFLFTLFSFKKNKGLLALSTILIFITVALSVPVMFFINQGGSLSSLGILNPIHRIELFTSLFRNIFATDHYPLIPWHLQVIYDLRFYLPFIFSALGLLSILLFTRENKKTALLYVAFAAGLLLSIFGTRTMFYFPGIIDHEQGEFALRLVQALFVVPLPLISLGLIRLFEKRRIWLQSIIFVILTVLILHSWYFSYPQFNLKYPFFSPSVSQDDIDAVNLIDELADGKSYVVLSNQMTSAAALQEFGFAHYFKLDQEEILWYAIPTGSKLYTYYMRQLQANVAREPFDELKHKTGIDQIYFVTHSYWPWTPSFVSEMTRISDNQFSIEDKVSIYQFTY